MCSYRAAACSTKTPLFFRRLLSNVHSTEETNSMAISINPLHLLVIKERSVAAPFWGSRLPLCTQNPNIYEFHNGNFLWHPEMWNLRHEKYCCANLIRFVKPICPHGWLQNCWGNIWYLTAEAVVFQLFHASLLQKGPDSHHFILSSFL